MNVWAYLAPVSGALKRRTQNIILRTDALLCQETLTLAHVLQLRAFVFTTQGRWAGIHREAACPMPQRHNQTTSDSAAGLAQTKLLREVVCYKGLRVILVTDYCEAVVNPSKDHLAQ